jgi:transglutaminase-like putative cysteine protease
VRIHHGNITHNGEPSYHAWINVWLNGQWVMYDPSFYRYAVTDDGLSVGNEYLDTTTRQ